MDLANKVNRGKQVSVILFVWHAFAIDLRFWGDFGFTTIVIHFLGCQSSIVI